MHAYEAFASSLRFFIGTPWYQKHKVGSIVKDAKAKTDSSADAVHAVSGERAFDEYVKFSGGGNIAADDCFDSCESRSSG